MSQDSLTSFYSLVEKNIGIALDTSKNYLLESRLSPLSKKFGYSKIQDFIDYLNRTNVCDVHRQAFEALTTNETMFFRDNHVFDALRSEVFPKLIHTCEKNQTLRIWCSAVSTGQEAYSIAITLSEYFPELSNWQVVIQATDISPNILAKAKSGIYSPSEVSRGLDKYFLQKYFVQNDDGFYTIKDKVRNMISFSPHNLVDNWPAYPLFDLIMLRNVLIYFSQDTKNKVLQKTHKQLSVNGILILGAAESVYMNPLYKLNQLERMSYYSAS